MPDVRHTPRSTQGTVPPAHPAAPPRGGSAARGCWLRLPEGFLRAVRAKPSSLERRAGPYTPGAVGRPAGIRPIRVLPRPCRWRRSPGSLGCRQHARDRQSKQFECSFLHVANTDFMIYLTPHPIAISFTVRHTMYAIHLSSPAPRVPSQMALHRSSPYVLPWGFQALTLKLLSFWFVCY